MKTDSGQDDQEALNSKQQASLDRFTKKLPAGHDVVSVEELPSNGRAFSSDVPGRVPGSKAIYRKEIDKTGDTIRFTKTTIDPAGKIIHIKFKFQRGQAGDQSRAGDEK